MSPQRPWEEMVPQDFLLSPEELDQTRKANIIMIAKVAARVIPSFSFMSEVLPQHSKVEHTQFLKGLHLFRYIYMHGAYF